VNRTKRPIVAVLTVLVAVGFSGPPAFAETRAGDNVVVVENYADSIFRARSHVDLEREPGPTVDNENVAIAHSECTDCRTVAVAVQAIIIEGPVNDFRPGNAAAAVNTNCLRCQTFAYARQEVLQADGKVPLSDDAEAQYEAIQDQIRDVSRSDASFDDITVQLDSLVDELVAVLQAEVDRAGAHATDDSRRDVKRNDVDE